MAGGAALAALVAGAVTYPAAHAAAKAEVDLGVEIVEFSRAAPDSDFYRIGARVTNHGPDPVCCENERYVALFTLTDNAVIGPITLPPRHEATFVGPITLGAIPPNNFQEHRSSLTIIDTSVAGTWTVTVRLSAQSLARDPNPDHNVVRFPLPVG
jgi:hypothetical protein